MAADDTIRPEGSPGAETTRGQRRFVVLSQPRTGSNNLTYSLDAHPEITCGNELLHPQNGIAFDPKLLRDERGQFLEPVDDVGPDGIWIRRYPRRVLQNVIDFIESDHTGFKIHLIQLWPECRDDSESTRVGPQ